MFSGKIRKLEYQQLIFYFVRTSNFAVKAERKAIVLTYYYNHDQ